MIKVDYVVWLYEGYPLRSAAAQMYIWSSVYFHNISWVQHHRVQPFVQLFFSKVNVTSPLANMRDVKQKTYKDVDKIIHGQRNTKSHL